MYLFQTIFEVNSTKNASGFEIMKKKRKLHSSVIESKKLQIKERHNNLQELAADGATECQPGSTDAEIEVSKFSLDAQVIRVTIFTSITWDISLGPT